MDTPLVSIIFSTFNRPDHVVDCARSILASSYGALELVVVDQSEDDRTERALLALGDKRIYRIPMRARGKSKALNFGLPRCKGDIVAFTDDDCIVEPCWVGNIMQEFQDDPRLQVVYGPVKSIWCRPDDTNASSWIFTNWGSFYHPEREIYSQRTNVYRIGAVAMGSNMSYRRNALKVIGPFDENLGPGSPLVGGDDFDFIYRTLRAGLKSVYTPTVLLYHKQWKDEAQLRSTLDGYVRSDAAIMIKHLKQGDWRPIYCYVKARILEQFIVPGLRYRDRGRIREGILRFRGLLSNLWFCWNWYRQAPGGRP